MSKRYEHTKIKVDNRSIKSLRTTFYKEIPEKDNDIWVITQEGDRLDNLAAQFYGNQGLWWYIARANNLTFMTLETGVSIRIPGSKKYAVGI